MAINIDEVVDYYKNLLIIQYNEKDKAKAEIDLYVRTLLNDDIYSQVLDGFDLDTAVGAQLDILGKIIGVDRFATTSGEVDGDQAQLVEYSDTNISFDEEIVDYQGNIFGYEIAEYSNLQIDNALSDDDYRIILKLKIIQNNSDASEKSIDDGLFIFFQDDIVLSASDNMSIAYFVKPEARRIALIAFQKGVLPRPMGVALSGLIVRDQILFSYRTYDSEIVGSNITGFTNYTDGLDKVGEFLTYAKVIETNG